MQIAFGTTGVVSCFVVVVFSCSSVWLLCGSFPAKSSQQFSQFCMYSSIPVPAFELDLGNKLKPCDDTKY